MVATDVDGDELEYTLGGTHAALFNIESTTTGGQLKTKVALDYETKTDYEVTVTATDDGAGTLSDTIRVTITVMNVNEPPMFPDTIAPIEVAENTVTGTNIGAPVVAMDVDSGDTLAYDARWRRCRFV